MLVPWRVNFDGFRIRPLFSFLFVARMKVKDDFGLTRYVLLGGGFLNVFLIFIPICGEMIQFDDHIFQMVWFNHQLV